MTKKVNEFCVGLASLHKRTCTHTIVDIEGKKSKLNEKWFEHFRKIKSH